MGDVHRGRWPRCSPTSRAARLQKPLRTVFVPKDAGGLLGLMPAYRARARACLGAQGDLHLARRTRARASTRTRAPSSSSTVRPGQVRLIANGSAITEIRTAAVSAVATRLLAREDARDARRSSARACRRAPTCRDARWRGRSSASLRLEPHAREGRGARPLGGRAVPGRGGGKRRGGGARRRRRRDGDAARTSRCSAGVARAGRARERRRLVRSRTTRELDVADDAPTAVLFVDRRESTLNESGDYLIPAAEGAIGPEHIRAELGELLVGAERGRTLARGARPCSSRSASRSRTSRRRSSCCGAPSESGVGAGSSCDPARRDRAGARERSPAARGPHPARAAERRDADAEIWLKLESLQPIGSFKIRGAANAVRTAPPELVAAGRRHGERRQHGAGRRARGPRARRPVHRRRPRARARDEARTRSSGSAARSSRCPTSDWWQAHRRVALRRRRASSSTRSTTRP